MRFSPRVLIALAATLALFGSACGSGDAASTTAGAEAGAAAAEESQTEAALPTVVVTTNILGDVVENIAGGQVDVVTLMPAGADPHDFKASAQQVAAMGDADALIVNGGSFEEGLLDVIEGADGDGVAVYEAISTVSTIEFGAGGHDDHGDEHDDHDDEGHDDHDEDEHGYDEEKEHGDHDDEGHDDHDEDEHGHDEDGHDEEKEHDDHDEEGHDEDDEHGHDEDKEHDEHGDEDHEEGHDDHDEDKEHDDHDEDGHEGHAHDGDDPHFWQDPARMAVAAAGIADFLIATVDGIDADAVSDAAGDYVAELEALDAEIAETLASVDESNRVLITNHDAFGYFGDRHDFEIAGTIIPSGSTTDGTSAQQLAALAELIQDEGVTAIFAETTVSDDLAQALASEVGGDIAVVDLFTGSLGDSGSGADTYIGMIRTNAERIADALAG